jgi:hypothetical protein
MPSLSAEEFWDLLASTGLVEPAVVTALRQAFAARPGATVSDSRAIAAWLAETGVLTRWQARRLGHGDRGPFVVGDYRLLERHDIAGSSLLFSARHLPSGNDVSLVRLDPRACQRPEVWETVVRRTESAHRMTDPSLSRTWALEQIGIHPLIVCERIDGEPLAAELERRGPLPLAEAGATALRIAAAVAELHASGDVHGSLSLDTVLRPRGGGATPSPAAGVRVLQFPLADDPLRNPQRPPVDSAEQIAQLGRRAAFVAPELTLPGAVSDQRSDVYAIGCILHALVTGRVPGWRGDPRATLGDAVTVGLPALAPPVPAEVGTLVGYLSARDPAGRYPTAVDAAAAIATCFGLPWAPPTARQPGRAAAPFAVEPQPATAGKPSTASSPKRSAKPVAGSRASSPARGKPQRPSAAAAGDQPVNVEAWFWKLMAWMFGLFFTVITALTIAWVVRSWNPRPSTSSSPRDPSALNGGDAVPEAPAVSPPAVPPTAVPPSAVDEPMVPAATPEPAAPKSGAALESRPPRAAVVVTDDAALPWVSPTNGAPPKLSYLPPGAQLVLVARPADLASDDEGAKLVKAFGPDANVALDAMAALCGHAAAEVEVVQAAWQVGDAGTVTAGYTIRLEPGLTVPDDADFRSRAWGTSGTREVAGATVHTGRLQGAEAAFWVPEQDHGRVLVIAPPDRIEAIVSAAAAGPEEAGAVLPPPLETLLGMLDETRHVTLFGMSSFLFSSGRGLFTGSLAELAEPLAAFLGDDVQAAAVSLHAGDDMYAEVDVVAPRDIPTARLATRLVADLRRMPDAIEDYCAGIASGVYGRKVIQRLPMMLRMLAANLRGAGEGGGVVLNARLPRQSGHNIALAAELALARPPAAGAVASTPGPAAPVREDVRAKLRRTITLSFTKDTLEKSIQMVSDEIGVPMEILGADLQLEGITKNQSFGLDEVDRPAEAVLLSILAKANTDGKLIFVIRNRDGVESIEITTRAAAEKRGDPVPPPSGPS